MSEPVKGSDLAALQGANGLPEEVWKKLAADGHKFAILRLLVGNEQWSDIATVRANVERARHYGIALAPYLFFYPLPHLRPEEQIDRFAKLAEGLGSSAGDIPWMGDCEWPPRETRLKDGTLENTWRKWGCSPNQIKDWLLAAYARGKQVMGVDGLFYTFRYWLDCIEAAKTPALGAYALVLADYKFQSIWMNRAQYDSIKAPAPWTEISIVQFDGDGGLRLPNGVDADFDVCKSEEKFAELLATCGESKHDEVDAPIDTSGMIADASRTLIEDTIESYRRRRIDEALLPDDAPITNE